MRVDLGTQIRDYARAVDAEQKPITLDDLMSDYRHKSVDRATLADQRPFGGKALAAVAAILIVAVGLVVLASTDDNSTDAAGPSGDIEVLPFLDGLRSPIGVVFDPSGRLIIAQHHGNHGIVSVDILPDGSAGERAEVAGGECLHGLALGSAGELYFPNCRQVYRVIDHAATLEAERPLRWPASEVIFAGPGYSVWVALDVDGAVYVTMEILPGADQPARIVRIIEVLDDGGSIGVTTDLMAVPDSRGRPVEATAIEFAPSGEMFVANDMDEIWAVTLNADGSVNSLRLVATLSGTPTALEFDDAGTLYVGTGAGAVWSIESEREPQIVVTGFESVGGLAIDSSGTLYVTDVEAGEVLRIVSK